MIWNPKNPGRAARAAELARRTGVSLNAAARQFGVSTSSVHTAQRAHEQREDLSNDAAVRAARRVGEFALLTNITMRRASLLEGCNEDDAWRAFRRLYPNSNRQRTY